MPEKDSNFDQTLALCAECPDCDALVLGYASSHSAPATCVDEELWVLTCDRCGAVFSVPGDELLLRSIPVSWLHSDPGLTTDS
jgi:hypothetical protein